jgi:cytochrome c2
MKKLLALVAFTLAGCSDKPVAGGDAQAGQLLLRQYGCGTCHHIPGVAAAQGRVGPPLEGVAERVYLAGRIANTRENMAHFIRAPQAVDARTAMPDMQVTEAHARDMVAYLYTLK